MSVSLQWAREDLVRMNAALSCRIRLRPIWWRRNGPLTARQFNSAYLKCSPQINGETLRDKETLALR